MNFLIEPKEWISAEYGSDEIRLTSANIKISIGTCIATQVIDELSKSTRDSVRLSAYPLALWFVSSWWRLMYEPGQEKEKPNAVSWQMAHEIPTAGHGFIWPNLRFESDGETVDIYCSASSQSQCESIRYIEKFHKNIPINDFQKTLDDYINLIISRLADVGCRDTELHKLWTEVLAERKDQETTTFRQLEARLGFEPDDAPDGIINELYELALRAGKHTVEEIAPVCNGEKPGSILKKIIELSKSKGIKGSIHIPGELNKSYNDVRKTNI